MKSWKNSSHQINWERSKTVGGICKKSHRRKENDMTRCKQRAHLLPTPWGTTESLRRASEWLRGSQEALGDLRGSQIATEVPQGALGFPEGLRGLQGTQEAY